MNNFNVYQVDQTGACWQLGPEHGFSCEEYALSYARLKASDARRRMLYVVVAGSEIVEAYPSADESYEWEDEGIGEEAA